MKFCNSISLCLLVFCSACGGGGSGGGGAGGNAGGGPIVYVTKDVTVSDFDSEHAPDPEVFHNFPLYGVYYAPLSGTQGNSHILDSDVVLHNSNIVGTMGYDVYGVYAINDGTEQTIKMTNNSVTISESNIQAGGCDPTMVCGKGVDIYGAWTTNGINHIATENRVSISNSTLSSVGNKTGEDYSAWDTDVVGGYAVGNNSTIANNSVSVSDGSKLQSQNHVRVYGGHANINLGNNSTITNNSVSITDSSLFAAEYVEVIGGVKTGGNNAQITNNSVYISNSTITSASRIQKDKSVKILGGYAKNGGTGNNVTNNKVTFHGNVTLELGNYGLLIAGGSGGSAGLTDGVHATGDFRTGNTLVLDNATVKILRTGAGVKRLENFDKYVFKPSYAQIMDVDNTPMIAGMDFYLGTDAHLSIEGDVGGSSTIPMNQQIVLMQGSFTGNFENINDTFALQQGLSSYYDVEVSLVSKLIAKIASAPKTSRQASVPAEAQVASTSLLNEATNFVSGAGITSALSATRLANANSFAANGRALAVSGAMMGSAVNSTISNTTGQTGISSQSIQQNAHWANSSWASFSAASAGSSSYNSSSSTSSIDVDSYSILSGLARRFAMQKGSMLVGLFAEYGNADIDTHNKFDSQSDIKGTGDSSYMGGGILGRFDHYSGMYADASLRLGRTTTEHSSSDYQGFSGRNISYDTESLYFSTHIALGYNWKMFGAGNADVYAKYLWAHMSGDDANIIGDEYKFSDVNSHRARLGTRYTHALNKYISPFFGAAYEYEFDSYAHSSVRGMDFEAPNLRGGTGIFEGGISLTPLANGPVTLDLNTEIFVGMREGYMVNAQLVYDF